MKYAHLFPTEMKTNNEVNISTQAADFINVKTYVALDMGDIWDVLKKAKVILSFGTGAYLKQPSTMKQFLDNHNFGIDMTYPLTENIGLNLGATKSMNSLPGTVKVGIRVNF